MAVWQAGGDSTYYFRTIPRRMISLWTGELYDLPVDGRQGGHPCRFETDEEYESRLANDQITSLTGGGWSVDFEID